MFEEKDFDFAIDTVANLRIYVDRISKSLGKSSKDLSSAIDLVGCVLSESKERIFPVERS